LSDISESCPAQQMNEVFHRKKHVAMGDAADSKRCFKRLNVVLHFAY